MKQHYILQLKEGEKVVLKIWDEQSIEEVEYLLDKTSYLSNNGVPTPEPIRFNNGKLSLNAVFYVCCRQSY